MHSIDPLPGNYRKLRKTFGRGELRFGPGSYWVGVGSIVAGRAYELLAGDLRQLPHLELPDLTELADLDAGPVLKPDTQNTPRLAAQLLAGKHVDRYATRSEAEQALVNSLVNVGHDWGQVLALCLTNPCAGKFRELYEHRDRDGLRWLRRAYDNAVTWTREHESPGRRKARLLLEYWQRQAFPGRTGSTDRVMVAAHIQTAYMAGRVEYTASTRQLAELAAVGHPTAQRANKRIIAAGWVKRVRGPERTGPAAYTLAVQSDTNTPHTGCEVLVSLRTGADAFRYRGLGKAAEAVWSTLRDEPGLTVGELVERTGKHRSTVLRNLARMSHLVDPVTGELLRMVHVDEADCWHANDVDLTAVARAVGTEGAAERQRKKHEGERRAWRRAIERQREWTEAETRERQKEQTEMTVVKQTRTDALPMGEYEAQIESIEETDGQYGKQFKFTFALQGEHAGRTITGWCSQSFSPKSKLYAWARAAFRNDIPGTYDLDTDDLVGRSVTVALVTKAGDDGAEYNRLHDVKPSRNSARIPVNVPRHPSPNRHRTVYRGRCAAAATRPPRRVVRDALQHHGPAAGRHGEGREKLPRAQLGSERFGCSLRRRGARALAHRGEQAPGRVRGNGAMRHTSTWKSVERRVAAQLNGQRMGPGGDRADVRSSWLTVEVKHRKTLPAWLKDAVQQAVKYSEPMSTTLPVAVLHEEGRHDSYVVLRLSDFRDWFGNLPDNWHDERELPF